MSTITLPNIRVSSDLTVSLKLKDDGVAIDWSTLSNVKVSIYSDAQRALAGRCTVSIDEDDPTLLVCTYAANKPQYVGVNRVVVCAKYMGETKTYDKPAFNFVRWTDDQAGQTITIDDPDIDVEISVEDISSSILQEAVDAAFTAADRANDAAAAAEHMVDIHTGPQGEDGKSAYQCAVDEGYIGTEEEWLASLKGTDGADGDPAGFGTVSASVGANTGTPSVTVTTSGPDTAKNITFAFDNLKGATGETGATPAFSIGTVTTGAAGSQAAATITGTAAAPVLNLTIPQGDQGNTGSSVDYAYELVNNLTTNDATKGLSAAQGVVLDGKVTQLEAEVIDFEDAVTEQIENYRPIVIEGDVTNAPDEEDITTDENNLLKFANRSALYGNGYTILRRDKTFAEQVVLLNTIYEIRYNFDLDGETVTIPSGCTLFFNGGRLSNGSLVYTNTEIQGEPLISCTCTGSLRNTIVTPQMYGAKGDGITDDFNALNNAIHYNDTMFVPAGVYIISNKILLTKNKTVYGVGRESKIHNIVNHGFEKYCFEAGSIEVGTAAQSFLTITPQSCTISSDRWSVLVSDTSDYSVGDIVYICVDEAYSTKNPKNSWSAKVVSIVDNTSLGLDAYVDQDSVAAGSCLIRNMKHLPTGSISENICIHDLTLANVVDEGSGMYVIGFSAYNASFYNLWMRGNTLFGANYAINVTIDNIVGEFDGGVCDIPEISQFAVMRNCHAKRYGARVNIIGLTFLQGYKVTISNNVIDFGGLGKVGVGNHLFPSIHDNEFLNVGASDTPIDLSTFGYNTFKNNRVTTKQSSAIVTLGGATVGNIFTGNYIDNPGFNRWLYNFNSIDYQNNTIKDNITTQNSTSDAYFMDMVNTRPESIIHQIFGNSNISIASGATRTIFDTAARTMGRPRLAKITIISSEADYKVDIYNASSHTTLSVTECIKLELYIFAIGSYIRYVTHKSASTSSGAINYNLGQMTKIILTNNGQDAMTLHAAYIDTIR